MSRSEQAAWLRPTDPLLLFASSSSTLQLQRRPNLYWWGETKTRMWFMGRELFGQADMVIEVVMITCAAVSAKCPTLYEPATNVANDVRNPKHGLQRKPGWARGLLACGRRRDVLKQAQYVVPKEHIELTVSSVGVSSLLGYEGQNLALQMVDRAVAPKHKSSSGKEKLHASGELDAIVESEDPTGVLVLAGEIQGLLTVASLPISHVPEIEHNLIWRIEERPLLPREWHHYKGI
ncbi:hypothetical protein C8T65DRAFT_697058 [Cerioporus squamosus]|nr:hypothetical protein C8T65DRAFT_697058 [Cerioporus squamosus]